MMIKAALFDLDDTLYDHRGCAREALTAVQGCHDRFRSMTFDALERAHARFLEELHAEVMLGRMPLEAARVERFRRLLTFMDVPSAESLAARIATTYRDAYRTARRAIAGAPALLAAINSHAPIAVVSNNLLEEQQEKLRTCGLDRFVDALIVSEEAGTSKPDPAIFLLALDRLQALPGDAVMVGDSWTADVVGARSAGIRDIWFNPDGALAPAGETAVPELRALEPVEDALRTILDTYRD
jgi:HAD superfamily hydrolase (TIGR01549 family)